MYHEKRKDIKMSTINKQVAEFFGGVLMSHTSPLKKFQEKLPELSFDGENEKLWQFIVLKSFEEKFFYLIPLSNYLIENEYVKMDENMTTYAALIAYKIELATSGIKNVEKEMNQIMSSFQFTERIVIKNDAIDNLYGLADKIMNYSNSETIEKARDFLQKYNIDSKQIKVFPKEKSNSLKMS